MKTLLEKIKHQKIALIIGGVVLVIALIAGGGAAYAYAYNGSFYPGVSVGTINVGGQTQDNGRAMVNKRVDDLFADGVEVSINGSTKTIPLRAIAQDDPDLSRDLVILNTDAALSEAFSIGRRGSFLQQVWEVAHAATARPVVNVEVETDKISIQDQLLEYFGEYYDPAVEPGFEITFNEDEEAWMIEVTEGHSGRAFDLDEASDRLTQSLSDLGMESLSIAVVDGIPTLTYAEVESLKDEALMTLESAPYELVYDGGRFDQYEFALDAETLALALVVAKDGDKLVLIVNDEIDKFFEPILEAINNEAQDARFSVTGDRVNEFRPSKDGRSVNVETTVASLNKAFEISQVEHDQEIESIEITVDTVEPAIPTGSVNDLGITEILGVGASDFSGSPSNRINNLRHGISKLNGVLIAPGVEYSLINQLRPFTIADGYLPELVIKGDEIKPEVGGGLCQIGTTVFRAVMNAGLKITQRRNHSLVVGYYNDATNGNPGTDATLYDPAPDFRFVNDTGNYILMMNNLDVETGQLTFTFWGTNDGRKGYYTPPIVKNWIGAGPTQTTYTADLPPGARKCQGAHPGANTSFTYIVERSDGTVEEVVYESHYRPLPTICLVGLSDGQSVDEDGGLVEAVEEEVVDGDIVDEVVEEEVVEEAVVVE
ncbi:VanW family protein [Candidatus Uhrbacteria bacterium]|nr:VanW family protein [Candidatus Uhrbacteria bacterium]